VISDNLILKYNVNFVEPELSALDLKLKNDPQEQSFLNNGWTPSQGTRLNQSPGTSGIFGCFSSMTKRARIRFSLERGSDASKEQVVCQY
jgi:hypothetical protein